MRPVRIVIDGLRSYQSRTEIDFSELSLFALIGDTGAGKSSIIEAMCLALYNSTTWSGKNVTELIADGSEQMRVKFTFTAAGDTWVVTRAHRRKVGPSIHKLVSTTNGEKVDNADPVTRRVAELLGLNREQFLKAVVMPQGRFEELLRATPGVRTDILKGIFRLQSIDRVRHQVDGLKARWSIEAAERKGRRAGLPPDPDVAVSEAADARAQSQRAAARLREMADAAEQAHEAVDSAESAALELRHLADTAGAALDGRSRAAVDALVVKLASIETERARHRTAAEVAARRLQEAETAAGRVLDGFPGRDPAVTGRDLLRAAAVNIPKYLQERDTAVAVLAKLEASPPPPEIDQALVAAATEAARRAGIAQEQLANVKTKESEARTAHNRWAELTQAAKTARMQASTLARQASEARSHAEAASVGLTAAQNAVADATRAKEQAARAAAASHAAAGCVPGDACPICARPLPAAFVPPVSEALDLASAELESANTALADRQSDVLVCQKIVSGLDAKVESAAELRDQTRTRAAAAAAGLAELVGVAPETEIPADYLAGLTAAVVDRTNDVAAARWAAEAAAGQANNARETLAQRRSEWSGECQKHRERRDRAITSVVQLGERLAELPPAWRARPDAAAPVLTALADRLDLALHDHKNHLETAGDARRAEQEAHSALIGLDTRTATEVTGPLMVVVTADQAAYEALRALAVRIDPTPGLMPPAQSGQSVVEVAAAVTVLDEAGVAVLDLAAAAADGQDHAAATARGKRDAILRDSGADTVTGLRSEAGAASARAEQAAVQHEEIEQQAAMARAIDEFLGVAEPFLAALDALGKTLTDGKFIGYLVRRREIALLTEASVVLRRLTGDRFGFAEGFAVVDRRSGRQRAANTLSGGERFQASLALALALVEIATRGGGQLEAVFVDEGFGSLDSGALEQALTTLSGVAADGKLVALVSHVRQVAEHVDQVLLVERDDVLGSKVRLLDPAERDALLTEAARSRMTE